jgi:hypothetical protein
MKRPFLVATLLVLGGWLAATATLRAQDRQRAMYVSVLDAKGAPAENIGLNDLIIREDSVAREVLRVSPANDPIQIALLIDTSQAAQTFIRDYRQAVPAFLDVVLGEDTSGNNQVAIIGIGERPTILTDYTSNRGQLTTGVNRLFSIPQAGTYLLDAIMEVSQGLQKRGAERAVMVAITSEGPELSNRGYRQVLDRLKASGATLHVVTIGSPANMAEDRTLTLSLGTKNSGGRYDTLLIPSALATRLKDVGREIIGQYRVTYARPDSLIPPEKIEVSARREGWTVRGIPVVQPPRSAPKNAKDK